MHKKQNILSFLLMIIVLFLLNACTQGPSKSKIADAVAAHYRAKGFEVVDVTVGDIRPMPIDQKQYMGTPAYDIDITRINLKIKGDDPTRRFRNEEENLILSNTAVRIREKPLNSGEWVVVNTELPQPGF